MTMSPQLAAKFEAARAKHYGQASLTNEKGQGPKDALRLEAWLHLIGYEKA